MGASGNVYIKTAESLEDAKFYFKMDGSAMVFSYPVNLYTAPMDGNFSIKKVHGIAVIEGHKWWLKQEHFDVSPNMRKIGIWTLSE